MATLLAVWGPEQVMLPAPGIVPPFWQWNAREVATDAFHQLMYEVATSLVYATLDS